MKNKTVLSLTNPWSIAHALEQKGTQQYLRLAASSSNVLAKKLFYSLAKKEVDHAQRLDELFSSPGNNDPLRRAPAKTSSLNVELRTLFASLKTAAHRKRGDIHLNGYKAALRLEEQSVILYRKLASLAKSPSNAAFFDLLAKEEQEHYDALAHVYYYLTDQDDWIREDEGKTWNWMNI